MQRNILLSILFLGACTSNPNIEAAAPETRAAAPEPGGETRDRVLVFSHHSYDAILGEYVNDVGMVDYPRLLTNRAALDGYLQTLAGSSPKSAPKLFPSREHQMAYWINAYNALMLRAVIDNYPLDSVTDIKVAHGVFSRINFPVGGVRMSLDDIEKGVLLKEFDDPRVHWALTCASMSCPRLDRQAFAAEGLSERLEREARAFLQSPRAIVIEPAKRSVRLSKYFDWYGKDFGGDAIAYVRPYLSAEQLAQLATIESPAVSFMEYDWRLNDQTKSWAASE